MDLRSLTCLKLATAFLEFPGANPSPSRCDGGAMSNRHLVPRKRLPKLEGWLAVQLGKDDATALPFTGSD